MGLFSKKLKPPNNQIRSKVIDLMVSLFADYISLSPIMDRLMEIDNPIESLDSIHKIDSLVSNSKATINHIGNRLWPSSKKLMSKFDTWLDKLKAFTTNAYNWSKVINDPDFNPLDPKTAREHQQFIRLNRKLGYELDMTIKSAMADLLNGLRLSESQFEKLLKAELDRRGINP